MVSQRRCSVHWPLNQERRIPPYHRWRMVWQGCRCCYRCHYQVRWLDWSLFCIWLLKLGSLLMMPLRSKWATGSASFNVNVVFCMNSLSRKGSLQKHDILWHQIKFNCHLPTLPNYDMFMTLWYFLDTYLPSSNYDI